MIDPRIVRSDPVDTCRQAVAGGATAIQLRVKDSTDREILKLASALKPITDEYNALLFVNDRVEVALAAGADGVHLGVDDLSIADARSIAGEEFVVGFSPDADERIAQAVEDGASYLGIGPVYGTTSKTDAGPAVGLATLARRIELSELPVVGIGGIEASNAKQVIAAGACGVAVMSAIIAAPSPFEATRALADQVGVGGATRR